MTLLSPDDIERIKEINKKLQGKRLVCGPIDDIGPLDITIDDALYDYRERDIEEITEKLTRSIKEYIEKNFGGNNGK